NSQRPMQAMLCLLLLFQLPLVSTNCIQCASPTLFNQWQLTGLPSHPASLPFTPLCNSIGTDDPPEENMKVSSCSTVCFEMVIPSANQYHFVRGCHDEFIETGVTEQQVTTDDKCFYSKKGDQLITSTDGKIQVPAVAAIHFAKVGGEETVVNAKLSMKTLVLEAAVNADPAILKTLTCSDLRPVNCVKSMYYDGTGEDNNKQSCSGGVCTSIEGHLNGRKYIERGCAPISPYTQTACVTMRTNSTFAAGPGDGGSVSREKRSLNVILDATECFCSTEYCNTSSTNFRLSVILSAVVLAATGRFLY
ncbi:hypothetical protein V3C99_011665, partial [Haemonchus contortus]